MSSINGRLSFFLPILVVLGFVLFQFCQQKLSQTRISFDIC
jgi:F0F1-type ATP synthase assembly protein I